MAGGLITNYINKGSGAPSVGPSVPTGESAYYYDETNGDLYVYNTTATAWQLALSGVFSGEVSGTDLKATGLTGTALSVRLRGGNASGAPSTGTGVVRDLAVNSDGSIYICTVAGSPGTWTAVSGGGGGSSTLAGDTDVTISSPANKDALVFDTSDSKWHNKAAFFPAGELGYTQITTASLTTASTSLVDVTGLSVTVTIGSRAVVVRAYYPQWSHSTVDARALLALIDSTATAQIQAAVGAANAANAGGGAIYLEARVNPAAGSRTYKVQFEAVDAGTVTLNAGTTKPAWIQVVEV